jgi:predicted GTPase
MPSSFEDARKPIAKAIERLEEILGHLPLDAARDLRERIATTRTILLDQRAPALVLVGRRGAGKSSLLNALFGAKVADVGHVTAQTGRGRWFDFENDAGALSILDTRGVQEGAAPAEADDAATPVESIALELRKKAPDAVLLLVRASDVDAAIDGDLDALEVVLSDVERAHRFRPPILAVVTCCDLLEPKLTKLHDAATQPVEDLDEKLAHVDEAERALVKKLRARPALAPQHTATVAVSSYMSWREDGTLRADERWHIDALSEELFKMLPNAGRGMFVRIARMRGLQEQLADTLTKAVAAACAAVGAVPIPMLDIIPITTLQATLVAGIAWISGRKLDMKGAGEFLAAMGVNVGAAFVFRAAFRAAAKGVAPPVGAVLGAGVAFTGTMALGAAARAYFIRGESLEDAKKRLDS